MSYRYELTISSLLKQTLHRRCNREIVYKNTRYTWTQFYDRVQRLSSALEALGVKKGFKVAVADIDTNRYLEAYYAVPMMGAILHTVNIRLPPEQLAYTMSHAEDDVVLIRDEFLPLAQKIASVAKTIKAVVVMSDSGSSPGPFPNYEDILSSADQHYEFPELDEETVATLFYTSGTTGLPKGVYFTHRQLVLHTLSGAIGLMNSRIRVSPQDVVMPLVPFFHVHGWGIPYTAGLMGQKVVLAGKYDPASILKSIEEEGVTLSNMVPTILASILSSPEVSKYSSALSRWKVVIGGAALPRPLAQAARKLGIQIMAGYGLSETAPILTLGVPVDELWSSSDEELLEKALLKTGQPIPLVEVRVVNGEGRDVPRDGKTIGEIVVRTPWATKEYYKDPELTRALWEGGWLHTGDLATVDERGYLSITDRLKDTVKSGGEWISSLMLEEILLGVDGVVEAAVIPAAHRKWGERPVAVVYAKPGVNLTEDAMRSHLMQFVEEGKIGKFWVPDRFIVESSPLPKTSTGKIDKKPLREKYSSLLLDSDGRNS